MIGQVTTLIVDLNLEGGDHRVDVAQFSPGAELLRSRVYRRHDHRRDLWEVDWASVVVDSPGTVHAYGPSGPVRVILSVA